MLLLCIIGSVVSVPLFIVCVYLFFAYTVLSSILCNVIFSLFKAVLQITKDVAVLTFMFTSEMSLLIGVVLRVFCSCF